MATQTEKTKEVRIPKVKNDKPRIAHYWVRAKITGTDAYGLSEYGLSKWRDTIEALPCAYDTRAKRWLTGLDENDPKILSIQNEEERVAKQQQVKKTREELEALTGLNLSPTNDSFWGEYLIVLSDRNKPFVPILNPMDKIAITVLERRGDIPFGANDLYNHRFTDAKYYIETEEQEFGNKNNRKKTYKNAIAVSSRLEDDYDKLWQVCYLLQLTKNPNEGTLSLIAKLDEYIEKNEKYPTELERLVKIANMSTQELEALTMVEKAIKAGVVKFDIESKLYYRGGVNLGATKEDSMTSLLAPKNSATYGEIITEVNAREGTNRYV